MNAVHTIPSYSFEVNFIIIIPFMCWPSKLYLTSTFLPETCSIYLLIYARHTPFYGDMNTQSAEGNGKWIKCNIKNKMKHSEVIYNCYCWSEWCNLMQSRRMIYLGRVEGIVEFKTRITFFCRKLTRARSVRRYMLTWEDNIKIYLKKRVGRVRCHWMVILIPGGEKRTHVFSNNCNFVYFQYKKIMSTP